MAFNPYTGNPAVNPAQTQTGPPSQQGNVGGQNIRRVTQNRGTGPGMRRRGRGGAARPGGAARQGLFGGGGPRVTPGRLQTPGAINPEGLESLPEFSDFGQAAALGRIPGIGATKRGRGFNG